MNEILEPERRDALVREFANVANMDVLTNMDGLLILKILEDACSRANAEIEEGILKAMIDGPEGDPTPGAEE